MIDSDVVLLDLKDFVQDRQCEIEVNLDPGTYIILPRTTGCTLRRPQETIVAPDQQYRVPLMQPCSDKEELKSVSINTSNGVYQMSMLFESTVADIFRKFDMLLRRELGFSEFKGFCECVGRHITEAQFNGLLARFSSTKMPEPSSTPSSPNSSSMIEPPNFEPVTAREGGLTLEGFKQFMVAEIEEHNMDEERMFEWLSALGYDQDLYSIKSRCFMLTFHSTVDLSVSVRDAIQTDLDTRANLLIVDRFGQDLEAT